MSVPSVGGISLVNLVEVCAITLLVYDYLITVKREVDHVWTRGWTCGKIMFMMNRYLPFTDVVLAFYLQFASPSTKACVIGSTIYGWITLFGVLLSEIILMMRVYALWALRRAILIVLGILVIVLYVPAIFIVALISKSYQDVGAPIGCWKPTIGAKTVFLLFVIILISETVLCVLTVTRVWKIMGNTYSRLLVRIYRDGLIYYLYLFAISLTNLIIPLAAPQSLTYLLIPTQRVMHSILCNRVLLHIWEEKIQSDATVLTTRDISFAAVGSVELRTAQSE